MKEIWKDITGYEGLYQVSNLGRVKSLFGWNGKEYYKRDKILKPFFQKDYLRVSLFKKTKGSKYLVHRLVAETFISNPDNLPEVNHKDENPRNCEVSNLEWCTRIYNIQYSKSCPVDQYNLKGDYIQSFLCMNEAERQSKINHTHICQCCKGKRKTAGGYVWRYKDANK